MCVIIRKKHFLCFLFFVHKLPLLPNEYNPTQNAFQNCNRPGPQNYKSQNTKCSLHFYVFEVLNLSERKHLVFSDHDVVFFRCEIQIFPLNLYISKKV